MARTSVRVARMRLSRNCFLRPSLQNVPAMFSPARFTTAVGPLEMARELPRQAVRLPMQLLGVVRARRASERQHAVAIAFEPGPKAAAKKS